MVRREFYNLGRIARESNRVFVDTSAFCWDSESRVSHGSVDKINSKIRKVEKSIESYDFWTNFLKTSPNADKIYVTKEMFDLEINRFGGYRSRKNIQKNSFHGNNGKLLLDLRRKMGISQKKKRGLVTILDEAGHIFDWSRNFSSDYNFVKDENADTLEDVQNLLTERKRGELSSPDWDYVLAGLVFVSMDEYISFISADIGIYEAVKAISKDRNLEFDRINFFFPAERKNFRKYNV